MSELREAAQEALFWMQHARLHLTIKERLHPDGLIQYDNAARNLRAALAQPETAEPVAWQTFNGEGGYDYREFDGNENYDEEWRRLNPAHPDWVEPLYAHPPRDEWRPASEVPEDTRDVQAWIETDFSELDGVVVTTCEAQAYHEDGAWHVRGPDHDEWMQLCPGHMVQVVAWRDVHPPTEGKP